MQPRSLSPRLDCLFHVTNSGLGGHRMGQNLRGWCLNASCRSEGISSVPQYILVLRNPLISPMQVVKMRLMDCRAAEMGRQHIKTIHNVLVAGYHPRQYVAHRILTHRIWDYSPCSAGAEPASLSARYLAGDWIEWATVAMALAMGGSYRMVEWPRSLRGFSSVRDHHIGLADVFR